MSRISNKLHLKDLSTSLLQCIENISKEEGYIRYDFEVRDINTKGGNFLGKIFEIDIKGQTINGGKEISLFVKQKINLDKTAIMSADELYSLEEFIYTELSDIFALLQDKADIPEDERFKLAKAYSETSNDAIILENLCKKGFRTYDRMKEIPLKFTVLTVKELAKFHGLSFVMEKQMPMFYNKRIKVLEHPLHYDENWNCFMWNVCTYVANLFDDATKVKIEKFIPIFLEKIRKYDKDKTSTKCALTHGNCRAANVLVRDHNGDPEEAIIVDYQFMDYGCPMRDFYFAVFANTDHVIRRKHLNDLKEVYFETLSKFLKYFDMDVETVYPRKDFEKVYTEWLDYGLMKMLLALPFLFASETGVDLENIHHAEIPFSLDESLQDRVRELIRDFVDWGCL